MTKPVQDKKTIKADGREIVNVPHGLIIKESQTHIDDRGSLCEIYDPRWKQGDGPLAYTYLFTIRPGVAKGWGMHKKHEDRYFVVSGDLEVVLYDGRKKSPTHGKVFKIYLSDKNRKTMNIPVGVWHAARNIGVNDVLVVNCPTALYDNNKPDKYRLPLDTKEIPHSFGGKIGW